MGEYCAVYTFVAELDDQTTNQRAKSNVYMVADPTKYLSWAENGMKTEGPKVFIIVFQFPF